MTVAFSLQVLRKDTESTVVGFELKTGISVQILGQKLLTTHILMNRKRSWR